MTSVIIGLILLATVLALAYRVGRLDGRLQNLLKLSSALSARETEIEARLDELANTVGEVANGCRDLAASVEQHLYVERPTPDDLGVQKLPRFQLYAEGISALIERADALEERVRALSNTIATLRNHGR